MFYQSPIEATCVALLLQGGADCIGKTNLDEFGMGSTTTHSVFGPAKQLDNLCVGGSSGGSAIAVKQGDCYL